MKKRRRTPRIFFGWWMNLVTGMISGFGHGFYSHGFSALFKPISSELNFTRAATSVAAGIGRLESGFMSPLTGWLVDKFGPRWVVITGICIATAGLALMQFVNSLWVYYLVWGLIMGTGSNLAYTISIDKMLTDWFVSRRGLAFGIRFVLASIASVILLPLVTWLITTQGWRTTCLIWGGVMFACIPLMGYFVKQKRPEYYGLLPDGAEVEPGTETDTDAMIDRGVEYAYSHQETEFTLRQAMRTPSYWMLLIAHAGAALVMGSFNIHIIPFLTDMGIDPIAAGSMMAMMVFFTIPSRFLGGFLADRFRKEKLRVFLIVAFLLLAIGITVFLVNQTITAVYALLILYGLGSGLFVPLFIIIRGRYFGRKAYGSIHGTSNMFVSPLSISAAVYSGWVYDNTGSYTTAFTLMAAVAVFAAFVTFLVRPPKPPATVTDIRKFM
ncbi:MFS transporter [Chloroflexota bacterium]